MVDSVGGIRDCDFSEDGEYLYAASVVVAGNAYVYVYRKECFFCGPGFYLNGTTSCGACPDVIQSCSMCYNSSYCVSCFQGYYP